MMSKISINLGSSIWSSAFYIIATSLWSQILHMLFIEYCPDTISARVVDNQIHSAHTCIRVWQVWWVVYILICTYGSVQWHVVNQQLPVTGNIYVVPEIEKYLCLPRPLHRLTTYLVYCRNELHMQRILIYIRRKLRRLFTCVYQAKSGLKWP